MSTISSALTASSAYDLSAILEAATGASSSGIDVTTAVSASLNAAREPEVNWEDQQSTLQSQSTALTQIQTSVTALDNDVQALNSLTGPLSTMTVGSSNSAIVTGSAVGGTTVGNDIVVVNNLATTASWSSSAVASATTALPAETFTITGASGTTKSITTGNGVNTLSDLVTAINGQDLGVTANIVTDANGSRIAISSDTSGSAANFSVSSSDSSFGFTQAVAGTNASLTVNGISVSSASNTVTGAVPGLTLNLQSASPGTQVNLSVAADTSSATTALSQFVTDYNSLITQVNNQFTFNGSSQGVLADDPTVRSLQSDLLGALSYTATPASGTSTTMSNLSSLGVSVNSDGTLTLNSSTLSTALQNNFSAVQNFFQGTSFNGFANSLDQQLSSFTDPSGGAFTVDLSSMNTQNTTLQDDINNFETNTITPLQTQLQTEFSNAEIALQQLPMEMKNVSAELGLNNSSNG